MSASIQTPPSYSTDKRLDALLLAIDPSKGKWPTLEQDWEAAKRLQEEGVDLSLTQGKDRKVTLFHRLTKNLLKAKSLLGLPTQELLAPFRHLSSLTDGRALHPDHSTAWGELNQSFSVMSDRRERDYHLGVLELFIEHAKGPFSNSGNFPGMMHRATSLDLPEKMAWLCEHSPQRMDMWRNIEAGGPRVFAHLIATEPNLRAKRPEWEYAASLHDRLAEDHPFMPIEKLYAQWLAADDRNAFFNAQLPQVEEDLSPVISRRPRF